MKSNNQNKYQPIGDLYDLTKVDLYELHERLWYEFFTPAEDHTKEVAKFILEQLNVVGESINMNAPSKEQEVVIVDAKTKFEPKADDEGPMTWKGGCIYAVTRDFYKPKKSRVKVQPAPEVDLMGDEEDDLMGEAKPKKGKKDPKPKSTTVVHKASGKTVKTAGGKSNYDTIADLAKQGKDKDQIVELTGFERKTVTDNLWRYNQTLKKK